MTGQRRHKYEFDGFLIDLDDRTVSGPSGRIRLPPKVFDTLAVLIENAGSVVPKQEIIARVWPDTFVEQANLPVNISVLRRALGTSTNGQSYIETIPKLGYRLNAAPKPHAKGPPRPVRGTRLAVAASVAAVISAAILALYTSSVAPIRSVAVLPFVDSTVTAGADHLSDGLTETMIHRLARLRKLKVLAYATVFSFKGRQYDARSAGRDLGVDAVVAGRVEQEGNQLSVDVELVRIADGAALWSDRYDAPAGDMLSIQQAMARDLARALGHDGDQPKTTASADAFDHYLRAQHEWNKRTVLDTQAAIGHLEHAIRLDPSYAQAFAGLAYAYATLVPARENLPKAAEAARTAIRLDPTLADAHVALAHGVLVRSGQFAEAEREYRTALDLNPSHAPAHQWYALLLSALGRHKEAIAHIQEARSLDPLSLIIRTHAGVVRYLSRDFRKAVEEHRRTLELSPDFEEAHYEIGRTYAQLGKWQEAERHLQKVIAMSARDSEAGAMLAYVKARSGQTEEARKWLNEFLILHRTGNVPPFYFAIMYAGLGDRDSAVQWLSKAVADQSHFAAYLQVEPALDPIRSHPEFARLVREAGLGGPVLPEKAGL